jgi:hypothetical protein
MEGIAYSDLHFILKIIDPIFSTSLVSNYFIFSKNFFWNWESTVVINHGVAELWGPDMDFGSSFNGSGLTKDAWVK